jgi:hypothetical protein
MSTLKCTRTQILSLVHAKKIQKNLLTKMEQAAEQYRLYGTPSPLLKGVPAVFTKMIESGAPNLYEDDQFVLYLNRNLPYPDLDDSAAMAFVHMLACPKERIYNIVTCHKSDVPLLEYMRDSVVNLVQMPEFREKVILLLQEKMPFMDQRFSRDAEKFMNHTDGYDMEFCFHRHPNHSVGHLHMHCLTGNIRTNHSHDRNNYPLNAALASLR